MLKKLYIMLALTVFALVFPAKLQAADAGIYTATTTAYYAHPETGEVEDPGNNAGIGQPMTESVLQRAALVEIDKNQNTYITLRIGMLDQLGEVSFASQPSKSVSFQASSAQLMQKNSSNQTADYRFKVSSETGTIRISVYVTPMGRSVIFYGKLGGLRAGSGDFKTVLTSKDLEEKETKASENPPSVNGNVSSGGSSFVTVEKEEADNFSTQQNEKETDKKQESSSGPEIVEVTEKSNEPEIAEEEDSKEVVMEDFKETEEKSSGLTVIYNNKDTEEKEAETVTTIVEEDAKSNRILLAVCIIASVDLLITLVFGICYIIRRRKERQIIGG